MASVLVVDDIAGNVRLVASLLAPDGHRVRTAGDGAEALRAIGEDPPDLVLMDVMMPIVDGFEACRAIKADPRTRLIPVVLVTSLDDTRSRVRGIDAGADDFVSKPFNAPELRARVRSLIRIKRYTDDLDSAVVGDRQPGSDDRGARPTAPAAIASGCPPMPRRWGARSGSTRRRSSALDRGGYLHDVGKVGIPDAILLKPGRLTPEEFAVMQQHTVIGDRLCGELRSLRSVRPIVRHHHERLDGSGYPDGLRGDAIPLLAQIIGIVDVFDAITTNRPHMAAPHGRLRRPRNCGARRRAAGAGRIWWIRFSTESSATRRCGSNHD